ncbi:hypothetical protein BS50DRAFT_585826 [Corynespora cassiicola Philippines]|uniref:F-box domain-containing protein n=1 Tax=Corynespora cassiicola Philippines TaxID=1448308 RepID=A0A2T2NYP2_CORCC|nr:hypothetical protein BS50DRAFT_585826 [Corynespora cassiicola Philippines]
MPKAVRKSTRSSTRSHPVKEPINRGRRRRESTQPPTPKPTHRVKKRSILSFLDRSSEEIEADCNRKTRILSLSAELVKRINSYLPLDSAVCFSLTCKEALRVLGPGSWMQLKKYGWQVQSWNNPPPAESFPQLLSRDCRDILSFCDICFTLHPPIKPPRSHRVTRLTKKCLGQWAVIDYLPSDAEHGYFPLYSHIEEAMSSSSAFASKGTFGEPIDLLSGDFTISKPNLTWSMSSAGSRIDGNLILKHIHTFRTSKAKPLQASDILPLEVRICPHQSTTTSLPERSRYIKTKELNGPLFTHAILSALPTRTTKSSNSSCFAKPSPSEQQQMDAASAGENILFTCRSCPTKFQIRTSRDTKQLNITTWHNFGRDFLHAAKYWKCFVRREGEFLGRDKRNDEWWSSSKTFPDFRHE